VRADANQEPSRVRRQQDALVRARRAAANAAGPERLAAGEWAAQVSGVKWEPMVPKVFARLGPRAALQQERVQQFSGTPEE